VQAKHLATLTQFRPWVNQFLRQRNYGAQLSMLKLLCVVTKHLCGEGTSKTCEQCNTHGNGSCADAAAAQVAHWLPTLCQTYATHKKVKCREIFYSIIIWAWDKFDMERGPDGGFAVLADSRAPIQQALIQGLADEAEIIRAMVYEFWNHEDRLKEGLERVPQLLSKVYMPEAEDNWTGGHFPMWFALFRSISCAHLRCCASCVLLQAWRARCSCRRARTATCGMTSHSRARFQTIGTLRRMWM
jgi:transposase